MTDATVEADLDDAAAARAAEELDPRFLALLPSNDKRRVAFERKVARELAEHAAKERAACAAEVPPTPAQCRVVLRTAVQKHADLTHRLSELTKAVPKAESAVFAARTGV